MSEIDLQEVLNKIEILKKRVADLERDNFLLRSAIKELNPEHSKTWFETR